MITLALEFSSAQRSVALLDVPSIANEGPRVLAECRESGERKLGPLPLIEQVLHEGDQSRERIECIVVGLGPGSYTGIRSAIAIAQGWQLACGIRLMGLSSVEGLAAQAGRTITKGVFHVAIDAQREEFYLAGYQVHDGRAECVEPLRLASLAEVRALTEGGATLVGPGLRKWFPTATELSPCATELGFVASSRNESVAGESLEPIYLRATAFVKAPPPRLV